MNLCQSKLTVTFGFYFCCALVDDYSSRMGVRTPILLSQFYHELLYCLEMLDCLLLNGIIGIMLFS